LSAHFSPRHVFKRCADKKKTEGKNERKEGRKTGKRKEGKKRNDVYVSKTLYSIECLIFFPMESLWY